MLSVTFITCVVGATLVGEVVNIVSPPPPPASVQAVPKTVICYL